MQTYDDLARDIAALANEVKQANEPEGVVASAILVQATVQAWAAERIALELLELARIATRLK